jgi:hypothetical protein
MPGYRDSQVLRGDGLSVELPAVTQQLVHSRGELCERKGTICGQYADGQFGDRGAKGVGLERRPELGITARSSCAARVQVSTP